MKITFVLLLTCICGVLLILYAGVALIQDKKYFTSAPKDIQAAILPHSERFKGAHALGWLLTAIALIFIFGSVIYGIYDGKQNHFDFWSYFWRFLILLEGYKIWDMIFLDWYLLTKSHFYQHYFPEVDGCKSLEHTGFNRKEQLLKLCVLFPVVSMVLAVICTWIF